MITSFIETILLEGGTIVKNDFGYAIFTKGGKRTKIKDCQADFLQDKYKERLEITVENRKITYKLKPRLYE